MLVAVWQSWAVNYTSLVVTTTRLSCQTWWKPTTRPPARGLSLDDYLSRPSGTAVSAFSDSSCHRCPAPSSPLTSPSQTPSTCIGTNATKRSTISTTISTRTRTRMWTQRTEFGPDIFSLLSVICAMSSFTSSLCWRRRSLSSFWSTWLPRCHTDTHSSLLNRWWPDICSWLEKITKPKG